MLKAEKAAKRASKEVEQAEVKADQLQKIADRILNKVDTAAGQKQKNTSEASASSGRQSHRGTVLCARGSNRACGSSVGSE